MTITNICSFLVHPSASNTPIRESEIDISVGGKLVAMLADVFARSKDECDIDISFISDSKQGNACRSEVIAYARAPRLATASAFAGRLSAVTTGRSGMGLLFVMLGGPKSRREIVISRFPADSGILADETGGTGLNVKFLERVFMKNAHAYKSARYEGDAQASHDFWRGSVVDRQISHSDTSVSDYWIRGFLLSDFRATSEFATKRFAHAIRDVLRETDEPEVREQVSAASRLIGNLDGKSVSIHSVMDDLKLDRAARTAILAALPDPRLAQEKFKFTASVFREQVGFRMLMLSNGALLGATNEEFDRVFATRGDGDEKTYSTRGRVVDDRLRKERP